LRVRLALVARAATGASRSMLEAAAEALKLLEAVPLPCMAQELRLTRASMFAAQGKAQPAVDVLREVNTDSRDEREPALSYLFANRALDQLLGSPNGPATIADIEAKLRARGIVQPRRYARMYVPGIEEMTRRPSA